MSKKIIAILMCLTISASFIGCVNKDKAEDSKNQKTVVEITDDDLKGPWATDFTLIKFNDKFDNILKSVEEKTKEYGLQYTKEEIARDNNEKYITLENKGAEKNRLEGMYFGRTIYGDDSSSGKITMKLLLNFDGEAAKKDKNFDLGATSIAKYAEFFTEEHDRNYSELNEQILGALNSDKEEGIIRNQINGLYEECTVTKTYIVYTLHTKKLDFKKPEQ
ncbi:MAG: hypothetical protein E7214_12360 [Clostridium sp.]|nr:hypothetical protein [Clostridium sp.]